MRVDPTLELAMDLMRRRSVTPDDAGCQQLLIDRLEPLGFEVHRLKFGNVDNFWAERGRGAPLVVLAGHTDVVPPGSADAWDSDYPGSDLDNIFQAFYSHRFAAVLGGSVA